MFLITFNEWLGPGRNVPASERHTISDCNKEIAFATRLALKEAVDRIVAYQNAYNSYYRLAVNFRLLHVTKIENLSDKQLRAVEVQLAEHLPQSAQELEQRNV